MSQPADNSLGRKIFKIAAIVLGSLLGLVLIATILFLTFLEPYAERYLKKQVSERTDGLYSLQFEDIDIDLFGTTIKLSQLHLQPDSSVHRQQKEQGNASPILIELQTAELEIAGINLVGLIFDKHLGIGTIFIEKPDITLLYDKQVSSQDEKQQQGGGGLSQFMESFHIDEIDIPDATYQHLVLNDTIEQRLLVPELSLRVLDLASDSVEQAEYSRPFNADDIQISVKNYAFISPDSVYDIKVGLFLYSTKKEELLAKAVRVRADHQTNIALGTEEANRSIYNIKAPQLFITGLDLVEAYRTRELLVDKIILDSAFVDILENKNIPATADFPELSDLYENVSPIVKKIEVEDLKINSGAVVYRNKIEEITIIHELKRTDLSLQQVQIDSTRLFTPGDNFYAEEILIATEGYTYRHPHSPYTIKVPSLTLSTKDQYLQADSVQIIGDWGKNEQLKQLGKEHYIIYNIGASSIRFNDMDLIKALKTQKLEIGSIEVDDPSIDMLRDQNVEKPPYTNWLKDTYKDISGFVAELAVGEFRFLQASFTQHIKDRRVNLRQKLESASLLATGFYVDSAFIFHSKAKLPLEELRLRARDYTYWLPDNTHTFHLGSLAYTTRSEELTARSIEVVSNREANNNLKPAKSANRRLFDVSPSFLRVTGLDMIRAINTGKLAIDQVILKQPELAIYQDNEVPVQETEQDSSSPPMEGLFNLVSPVTINRISLEDGTFILRQEQDSVIRSHSLEHLTTHIKGIHLDADQLSSLDESLPVEEITLTARDYTYKSPNGLYTITLDSLEYSSTQEFLTARLFEVDADLEIHERLKLENPEKANRNLFDVSASKFKVTGLDLLQAYESGRFNIADILLTEPEVTIIQDQDVPIDQEAEKEAVAADDTGTREQLAQIVETFRVENIRILDGLFKISVLKDTVERSQVVELVNVNIEQLRLVSLKESDPLEIFDVDEIEVLIRDYVYLLPDSMYRMEVAAIRTSLQEQTLTIDSLELIPLYDRKGFVKKIKYEKDRYDITVPRIRMLGMNLSALYNQQDIILDKMLVLNPDIKIYRDKRVPMNPERRPKTLQAALLDADIYINVDTIKVRGGKLVYAEVAPKGVEPGTLLLKDTQLSIYNVTNDSVLIEKNPIVVADGETQFMGNSKLQVLFTFHLDHPEDYHTYEGSLQPMDFEAFNPITEKLMFVRIETGFINKAVFSVEATKHQAEGKMRFLYENLDMQLIDKEDPENPGFLRNAGSWLINTLVIKSNNPSRLGNFRKGPIAAERDYQKSIFNLMSSAMIDGIASSLMPNLVEKVINAFTEIP